MGPVNAARGRLRPGDVRVAHTRQLAGMPGRQPHRWLRPVLSLPCPREGVAFDVKRAVFTGLETPGLQPPCSARSGMWSETSPVWLPTARQISRMCQLMALAASRGKELPCPLLCPHPFSPLPTSPSTLVVS
jgi:hypothetical protein